MSTTERATNLIVAGRFRLTRYPGEVPDEVPRQISGRENFYYAGVGVTSRNYVEDNYIFKFDLVEDVPVGRYLGFTLPPFSPINAGHFERSEKICNKRIYSTLNSR